VRDDSSDRPGRRTARRRAAVGLSTVIVVAAACGGGHKQAAPTTTAPPPTVTTTTTTVAPTTTLPPPTFPLTGLPAKNAVVAHDPAVVIKIDNVVPARPQTGIQAADIVYDTEVEGGLSRLAAVFQSVYPLTVGPVRSGRLTDEGVADDLNHPVLVFAGTNGIFMPILQAQPVTLVTDSNYPGQFIRIGSNTPHNLYSNVASLAALSVTHTGPAPLFHYLSSGQAFAGAGATPAAGVSFAFPAASVAWAWDAATGKWIRTQDGTPDVVVSGQQISATNVVIYFVPYIVSGVASGEGVPNAVIPEGVLTGTGNAWIFSGGKVVKATWHRPNLTTPATYTDSTGAPTALTPGNTWVELAPVGTIPSITP
jgi:hypothetical protein